MKTATVIPPESSHRRVSLRVSKQAGETALKLLTRTGLLDRNSKIRPERETLVLPLVRQPSPDEVKSVKEQLGKVLIGQDEFEPKTKSVQSLEEILDDRLSPSLLASLPASFDIIGDIAVVELPPELLAHAKVVGEGILRVHKNVRAVFAKAGAVSGSDRIRPLRHLAGEERTTTIHKEFGCRFKVDLAKAYFSPRLSHEHQRIAGLVEPAERVVDLFAGVGPFSILIAKRLGDVEIDAVDSNPEAVRLIEENIRLNKPKGKVRVWAGDARDVVERNLTGKASRVIMNLPSAAKEYVDAACKALHPKGGILHYYTFAEGLDYEEKAVNELEEALASHYWRMVEKIGVRAVRGVAPLHWQVVVDARVAPAKG